MRHVTGWRSGPAASACERKDAAGQLAVDLCPHLPLPGLQLAAHSRCPPFVSIHSHANEGHPEDCARRQAVPIQLHPAVGPPAGGASNRRVHHRVSEEEGGTLPTTSCSEPQTARQPPHPCSAPHAAHAGHRMQAQRLLQDSVQVGEVGEVGKFQGARLRSQQPRRRQLSLQLRRGFVRQIDISTQ